MTSSSLTPRIAAFGLGAYTCLCAQTTFAQSANDKAAAEALFREAGELMAAAEVESACPKYQASQQLDPALGTLLRLADCYDRVGKTASAWGLFTEAEATALHSDQPDRAQMAGTRAEDLKARLSSMRLVVPDEHRVAGLSIAVNGVEVPEASWGTALPYDPGILSVEASAPGHKTWSTSLELGPGPEAKSLTVIELRPAPKTKRAPTSSTLVASPSTGEALVREPQEASSAQGTLGYVVGAAGLLGLVAGGVLSYRAYGLNGDSLDKCASDDSNACTEDGKALRDDAMRYGKLATIVSSVAGGVAVTGLVLVLSAPDEDESERAGVRLKAAFGLRAGSLAAEGSW
jgi:serine/threonine-protein kinase